jgi:hypothetical protein
MIRGETSDTDPVYSRPRCSSFLHLDYLLV